jgi:hypothetical protein
MWGWSLICGPVIATVFSAYLSALAIGAKTPICIKLSHFPVLANLATNLMFTGDHFATIIGDNGPQQTIPQRHEVYDET